MSALLVSGNSNDRRAGPTQRSDQSKRLSYLQERATKIREEMESGTITNDEGIAQLNALLRASNSLFARIFQL